MKQWNFSAFKFGVRSFDVQYLSVLGHGSCSVIRYWVPVQRWVLFDIKSFGVRSFGIGSFGVGSFDVWSFDVQSFDVQ